MVNEKMTVLLALISIVATTLFLSEENKKSQPFIEGKKAAYEKYHNKKREAEQEAKENAAQNE